MMFAHYDDVEGPYDYKRERDEARYHAERAGRWHERPDPSEYMDDYKERD